VIRVLEQPDALPPRYHRVRPRSTLAITLDGTVTHVAGVPGRYKVEQ
jgi:hypothetical protein